MTDQDIRDALIDRSVLALTMAGEARGDRADGSSLEERIAVGCVVRNRVKASGLSYRQVCFAPRQFSCWSPEGGGTNHTWVMAAAERVVNHLAQPEQALIDECLFLATGIMDGVIQDTTGGATHYYAPDAMIPKGRVPSWASKKPVMRIGRQLFLRA